MKLRALVEEAVVPQSPTRQNAFTRFSVGDKQATRDRVPKVLSWTSMQM